MSSLLTWQQQKTIKPFGREDNSSGSFAEIQQETENVEMPKQLGVAFFQDIQANPESYETLLSGGEFLDCNGNTIKMKGLNYVMAYFNFARFVRSSQYATTYSGLVFKKREETEKVDIGVIKNEETRNIEIATMELEIVRMYLEQNRTLYPKYRCGEKSHFYKPSIKTVRRTTYTNNG